ncbi:MAG: MFS transporter [Bacteroidia bacterium]
MKYLYLLRKYPRYIAYGMLHYFFSAPGQSFFLSLYTVYFLAAAGVDQIGYTWLYFAATLTSSLVLPSLGKLLDRILLRRFSVILGLVYAGFCVLAASVVHPALLVFALVGLRLCGQGLMPLTGSTAITRFFEAERGQALALVNFGMSFAEIAFPLLIVQIILFSSWQVSWLVMAALILVVFIPLVISLVPKDSPFQQNQELIANQESGANPQNKSLSRAEVLRQPTFYLLILVYLFVPFFFTGIVINKNLMGDINGWTETQLALALSFAGGARLVMNLLGGPLVDRFSATRTFSYLLLPILLGLIGLTFGTDVIWLYIFFMAMGVSASLSSLTSSAMWAEIYGTGHYASIRSIVTTCMQISTAIAPLIISWALVGQSSLFSLMGTASIVVLALWLIGIWQVRKLGFSKSRME